MTYRKVETRTHGDKKYRALSPSHPCGQHLWLWLLTSPVTCIIPGIIHAGPAGMAEMLGWPLNEFLSALAEIVALGMAKADFTAPLLFLPKAINHNRPQSPNVIVSWRNTWSDLPECPLKFEIWQTLTAFVDGMGKAFQDAFKQACPMPCGEAMPNQEPEQEQEKDKGTPPQPDTVVGTLPLMNGASYAITQMYVDELARAYPAIDVLQELREMQAWLKANATKGRNKDNIMRFVAGWLGKEQDKAQVPPSEPGTNRNEAEPRQTAPSIPLPEDLDVDAGRKAWDVVSDVLKSTVNRHSYETWLRPVRGEGVSNRALYLRVPTKEFAEHVASKYGDSIALALAPLGLQGIKPFYEVSL